MNYHLVITTDKVLQTYKFMQEVDGILGRREDNALCKLIMNVHMHLCTSLLLSFYLIANP